MQDIQSEILQSADLLGLARDSAAVRTALQTAQVAFEEGFTHSVALDLAQSALRSAAENVSAA